jgi:hypothetical protein
VPCRSAKNNRQDRAKLQIAKVSCLDHARNISNRCGAGMAVKYQAGVGPTMSLCHIYALPENPRDRVKLSLCKMTNVVRNYKADLKLDHPQVCRRCVKLFRAEYKCREILPADLGVSELID